MQRDVISGSLTLMPTEGARRALSTDELVTLLQRISSAASLQAGMLAAGCSFEVDLSEALDAETAAVVKALLRLGDSMSAPVIRRCAEVLRQLVVVGMVRRGIGCVQLACLPCSLRGLVCLQGCLPWLARLH